MYDEALGKLREARALILEEKETVHGSTRELAVALTNIDSAILWRQYDLQLKQPHKDLEKALRDHEEGEKSTPPHPQN